MKNIIISIFLLAISSPLFAQRRGNLINIDRNISVAKVNDYFEYCFHSQYKDNWCWAACVQMVFSYYGIDISQSRIVRKVYDESYDITANKEDIVSSINGWHIDGRVVHAKYESYKNAKTLIDAIVHGTPIITGLDESRYVGHAYVLTHIFFSRDSKGNMTPIRVVLVNPAKSIDLEESLSWSEFYRRINTIITITVS